MAYKVLTNTTYEFKDLFVFTLSFNYALKLIDITIGDMNFYFKVDDS